MFKICSRERARCSMQKWRNSDMCILFKLLSSYPHQRDMDEPPRAHRPLYWDLERTIRCLYLCLRKDFFTVCLLIRPSVSIIHSESEQDSGQAMMGNGCTNSMSSAIAWSYKTPMANWAWSAGSRGASLSWQRSRAFVAGNNIIVAGDLWFQFRLWFVQNQSGEHFMSSCEISLCKYIKIMMSTLLVEAIKKHSLLSIEVSCWRSRKKVRFKQNKEFWLAHSLLSWQVLSRSTHVFVNRKFYDRNVHGECVHIASYRE